CGPHCLFCDGDACAMHKDCKSGICLDGKCRPATCFDNERAAAEDGIDCGGPCLACNMAPCTRHAMCASQTCNPLTKKCECSHCARFVSKMDGVPPPTPATACLGSGTILNVLLNCVCKGACATYCNGCKQITSDLDAAICSGCIQTPDPAGCLTEAQTC